MEGFAVVVYDRTSGDEEKGQDVRAQSERTRERAFAAGFRVVDVFTDEDVSGSTEPWTRKGFRQAVEAVRSGLAEGILVREVSRVTRQYPPVALQTLDRLRDEGTPVESLAEGHMRLLTEPDPAAGPEETKVLTRLITCWTNWQELQRDRRRTIEAVQPLHAGTKDTKSGKPPHRPPKELTEEDLKVARRVLAEPDGNMSKAARAVSQFRGAFDTSDPKKRRERTVSRDTLARALGLRADRAQNGEVRQSLVGPHEEGGAPKGALMRTAPGGSS